MAAADSNSPLENPAPSSRRARRNEETAPQNDASRPSPYAREQADVRPSPYDASAAGPSTGPARPSAGSRRDRRRPASSRPATSRPATTRSAGPRPGLGDRLAERLDKRRNTRILTLGQKAFGLLAVTGMVLTGAVVAAGTSSAEVPLTRATFASNSRWTWVDDVSLGRTNSADQYAQAQVSGLRSREHAAAFFMRYKNKNDKIFVAVSGTEWRIQGSGARPLVGRFKHASTGLFRVEVKGQTVRVLWDNKVVTTQKLTWTYSGKGVIASIWQSSRSVRMTNVEASSLLIPTTPVPTTTSKTSTSAPVSSGSVSSSSGGYGGSGPSSSSSSVSTTEATPDPTTSTSSSSSGPWTSTSSSTPTTESASTSTSTTTTTSTTTSTPTTESTTTTPPTTTTSVTPSSATIAPVTTTTTTTTSTKPSTSASLPKPTTTTTPPPITTAPVTSTPPLPSTSTTAPVTTVPSDGSKRWLSGAAGDNMSNGQWEKWRGSTAGIAGTWDDTRAAQTELWSICGGQYTNWNRPLDIAIGGIYHSAGENWSAAANGQYDARWTQVLTKMKSCWKDRPAGNLYIRFAHEMNLSNDWKVAAGEEDKFVATFRRVAGIRDRVFPGAKLVFAPNEGSAGGSGDVRKLWPGKDANGKNYADGYVVDMYNHWPFADTVSEFDAKANQVAGNGAPVGIEKHRLYAESLGAWFGMGEWSNAAYNADGGGGGESPVFVTELNKWLRSHAGDVNNPRPGQVVYDVQFNLWDQYQFWSATKQPQTARQYAAIPWGQ